MKRIIALVLTTVMVMLLSVGCGGTTERSEKKPQPVTDLSKPDLSVEPKADPGNMKSKLRYSAGSRSDYSPEQ